jgi:5'(3')-deoxyribonucleotidase
MAKRIIAIDVDDVLANSSDALRRVVNERLNINLSSENYRIQADYWSYYETVWQQNGLASRISLADLEPMMIKNQAHVMPHDNALQALQKLSEHYRLIVVTSRPPSWQPATEEWLNEHFPDVFSDMVFTCGSHETVHRSKGQLCAENGVTWLIDDNVEHAQSAVDQGLEVILFGDYGWNQKAPRHIHRCKNWREIEGYFDGQD